MRDGGEARASDAGYLVSPSEEVFKLMVHKFRKSRSPGSGHVQTDNCVAAF